MGFWQSIGGLVSAFGKLFSSPPVVPDPPKPPTQPLPTAPSQDETLIHLLEEHNTQRRNNGLHPLSMMDALNRAAQHHAYWMARNRNMSHGEIPGTTGFDAQDFVQRIRNEGYALSTGGENIAAGQRSVPEVMDAWMKSTGHRANILSNAYWNVGFGVATDDFGHIYWCVVFATPMTRGMAFRRVAAGRMQVTVSLPRALVRG